MKNILLSIVILMFRIIPLSGQVEIELKESAKAIKPNVFALIFEINIPQGWNMGAVPYALLIKGQLDTFVMSIQLEKPDGFQLVGRLKASYAPDAGYKSCAYARKVTFVQLIKAEKDLNEKELLVAGVINYGISKPMPNTKGIEMTNTKKFFRFRLTKRTGLPKISVGHRCLTKDIFIQ